MAEDTLTERDVPPSPGKDLVKRSLDPPTPLSGTAILDTPPSDDSKSRYTAPPSIDTSDLIPLLSLLTNFKRSQNNLWVSICALTPEES